MRLGGAKAWRFVVAWALLALWVLSAAVLPLLHQIGHHLDHHHLPSGAIRYLASHTHDEPHAHDEAHAHADEAHADEAWADAGLGEEEDLRWLWPHQDDRARASQDAPDGQEASASAAVGEGGEREARAASSDPNDMQDDGPLDHGGAFHFGALALAPAFPALPILYFVLGQQPRVDLGRAECPWRWACPNAARDPPTASLLA